MYANRLRCCFLLFVSSSSTTVTQHKMQIWHANNSKEGASFCSNDVRRTTCCPFRLDESAPKIRCSIVVACFQANFTHKQAYSVTTKHMRQGRRRVLGDGGKNSQNTKQSEAWAKCVEQRCVSPDNILPTQEGISRLLTTFLRSVAALRPEIYLSLLCSVNSSSKMCSGSSEPG